MNITRGQCRAARACLLWSQEQLAVAAGVSRTMVTDFEGGNRIPLDATTAALRAAFENMGIEFPPRQDGRSSVVFLDPDPGLVERQRVSRRAR